MKYDSILFDFDGVLADSEPVHYECWKEILAQYGIDFAWEVFERECIGVSDREMLTKLAREVSPPMDVETLIAEYPRKKIMFRDKMVAAPPFLSETMAMVREVSNLPLAVVSSSGREEVEPPLVVVGIRDCFRTLVCGFEAGKLKPAPDPYLLAAERLNVRRPLVVEDSAAGETAGRAAGFAVVRVASAAEVPAVVRSALGS